MKMENTSLSISVCFLVLLFKFSQTQKRKVAVSQTLLYTRTHRKLRAEVFSPLFRQVLDVT